MIFPFRVTQREETRETSREHAPATLSLMGPSTTSTKHGNLRVIKDYEKEQILNACHAAPISGHFGINKTTENITTRYLWPSQYNNIQDTHIHGAGIRSALALLASALLLRRGPKESGKFILSYSMNYCMICSKNRVVQKEKLFGLLWCYYGGIVGGYWLLWAVENSMHNRGEAHPTDLINIRGAHSSWPEERTRPIWILQLCFFKSLQSSFSFFVHEAVIMNPRD